MSEVVLFDDGMFDEEDDEQWRFVGERLAGIERTAPWAIGDWLNYGEGKYKDGRHQAIQIFSHVSEATIVRFGFVASRIPEHERRDELSFWHHSEVAALPEAVRGRVLDAAVSKGLNQSDIRTLAGQAKRMIESGEAPQPAELEETNDMVKAERREAWQRYHQLADRAETGRGETVRVPRDLFLALRDKIPKPKTSDIEVQ